MHPRSAGIYAFSAPLLDGTTLNLADLRGRVLLVVNTASRCGFTPQYAALEHLFRTYKERGFTVLAFPCNQFGRQEPGSAAQIGDFCRQNYGATFPVFAKIDVNGPAAHPLFRFLKAQRRGLLGLGRIHWNFTKFLVDRSGRVVKRYAPAVDPRKIEPDLRSLLDRS